MSQMRSYFLSGILIFFFLQCIENRQSILLKSDFAEGLKKGVSLEYRGYKIGTIKDVSLANDGSFISEVYIEEEISLPLDSKFKMIQNDLLGRFIIDVKKGETQSFIQIGDTIPLYIEKSREATYEDIPKPIQSLIESIIDENDLDSVLNEIKSKNLIP